MKHIILAGDSIFDNGSYVHGDPDVTQQVKNVLDPIDKVTLLAIDGDITIGVASQLKQLPDDATHLFVSVGGNDALHVLHTLQNQVNSIGEGFLEFHSIKNDFERKYTAMLNSALSFELPTTLCTIYKPCFNHSELDRVSDYLGYGISNEILQKVATTALPIFNDIIFQEAVKAGTPLIDLRLIFDNAADYANPIEPSAIGGMKMAKIIKEIVYEHDFSVNRTKIYC
ncbi:uncharacterized protein METZ01_LOCUS122740 [marine metagenome]|uniref:SGNH hydrolase-type esterase domain-containing protein n=1 Tax=marine metagenome TaxID=408172 RepID=A0A381XYI0_9ZZZZ